MVKISWDSGWLLKKQRISQELQGHLLEEDDLEEVQDFQTINQCLAEVGHLTRKVIKVHPRLFQTILLKNVPQIEKVRVAQINMLMVQEHLNMQNDLSQIETNG
jgi:hypothetical protein